MIMKALLRASLAVLAIALISSSAFAYAPVWTDIPDVVIGDDPSCGSGFNGLFVFTDAFNFFNYVSDADTTSPSLRIVFAEAAHTPARDLCAGGVQGTGQEVSVNLKNEVTLASLSPADFSDVNKEVTAGGTISQALLTATGPGVDRDVVLIASDLSTTPQASNCFRVRAIDNACNSFTSEVPPFTCTNVKTWDTNFTTADWSFSGFPLSGGSGSVTSSLTTNALGIVDSTGAGANLYYAYWTSSSAANIPYTASKLYRARFNVSTNQANPLLVPAVRLTLLAATDQAEGTYLVINPRTGAAPTSTAKAYDVFVEPVVAQPISLSPQIIDGSATDFGTITIESILVDTCDIPVCGTADYVIDQGGNSDFSTWTSFGVGSPTITFAKTATQISLTAPALGSNTGRWEQADCAAGNGPTLAADKLYIAKYTVSSTTPQVSQPQFRMRVLDSQQGWGVLRVMNSRTGVNMPTTGGTTYNVYFETDASWAPGKTLQSAFDMLHFDPADSGTEVLTRIEFCSVNKP